MTPETIAELRRRHAALTPFALRFLSCGPGGEPFIALACEDGTPLPEPAFDAVLLFAELAAAELPALLDAADERDALRAERDALAAMVAGRCLSDITHRDEEHRQSVCMLPAGHAPLAHDDCMGCTWTDAEHWEPSAVDRVADEVARIADESQHEDWDSPRVRSIVGRIRRALDEADR